MTSRKLSARGFWRTVTKEVRRTAHGYGWQLGDSTEHGYAFQRWIAEIILSAEPGLNAKPDDAMLCSDDLNADLVFENAAGTRLLIVRARYQPRGRTVAEHPVSVFFSRHDKYMSRDWVLSRGSGLAAESLAGYQKKLDSGYSVAYYFISTGDAPPKLFDLAKSCSDRYAEQGLNIVCEVFDFGRLKNYYERSLSLAAPVPSEGELRVDDVQKHRLFSGIVKVLEANVLRNLYRQWKDSSSTWNIKRYLSTEKDTRIFMLATVMAVAVILATTLVQLSYNRTQVKLKKYEIAFGGIEKGYAGLLEAFTDLRSSPGTSSLSDFTDKTRRIEARYFAVEPFLNERDRVELWKLVQSYIEENRQTRINWEVARQKKNPKQDEKIKSTKSLDDQEELFLAYRAKLRDLFLKTMAEMR
jgi:hypothetical protein